MDQQINPKELLDALLNKGKELAEKGQAFAEDKLNIPEEGVEREQKLDGLKKGAIATAILVGLLGTKGGRSLTGKVIKVGSLAALGTAAYKGYQNWKTNQADDSIVPVHKLNETEAQERALLLIEAMVSAANADGKMDDKESVLIKREILSMNLPKGLFGSVASVIETPLSAQQLAAKVTNIEIASEVYLAARLLIDDKSSSDEVTYMAELVTALGLSEDLVAELDKQLV